MQPEPQASPTIIYDIPAPVWYGTPEPGATVSALPDTGVGPDGGVGWFVVVLVLAFVIIGGAVWIRRRSA